MDFLSNGKVINRGFIALPRDVNQTEMDCNRVNFSYMCLKCSPYAVSPAK
jgi:hypothetical protein